MKLAFGMAAILLAATSCSAPTEDSDVATDTQGVMIAEPHRDAVGLLYAKFATDSGTDAFICTGALIAPNVVLTAAHCMSHTFEGFYLGKGSATPPNVHAWDQTVSQMRRFAVERQEAHPDFRGFDGCPTSTIDLALVYLAESVENVEPLVLSAEPPNVGESCIMVGYGFRKSENGEMNALLQRASRVRVDAIRDRAIEQKNTSEGVPSPGDSGGPLLCRGVIVAADSCGNGPRFEQYDQSYARVDRVLSWIHGQVAAR